MSAIITNTNFKNSDNYKLPPAAQMMRVGYERLDFAASSYYVADFSASNLDGLQIVVQSLTVDNTLNTHAVTVTVDQTLQYAQVVASGEKRTFNVPAIDPSYIRFDSAGSVVVPVYFYNYPSLPETSGAVATGIGGASAGPVATALTSTNFTATATVGGALALAANALRKYLLIQNNDTTAPPVSIYVDFAAGASLTSLCIPPGASFEMSGSAVSIDDIWIRTAVASTSAGGVTILEGI